MLQFRTMTTILLIIISLLYAKCAYQRHKMKVAMIEAYDAINEYMAMADDIKFGDTGPATAEDVR